MLPSRHSTPVLDDRRQLAAQATTPVVDIDRSRDIVSI